MMTGEKNELFVANLADSSTVWDFQVSLDGSPTSNIEKTVQLVEQLYSSFDGLIRPLEIEYMLRNGDSASNEPLTKTIESSDKVTSEKISNKILENAGEEYKIVKKIVFKRVKTKIRLKDQDHCLTSNSDRYRTWKRGSVTGEPPLNDPLNLSILYIERSDRDDYYQIIVRTSTDIWFEDTEIGRVNRERLGRALSQLNQSINPDSVIFDSDILTEDDLKRRGFSNLLPE